MKQSNTSERLKLIMQNKNLKQVDILALAQPFCKKYNVKLNKNDLSQYVSGKVEPGQHKLSLLGCALNVSEAWLMGYDVPMERTATYTSNDNIFTTVSNLYPVKTKMFPILGKIACGKPIFADENHESYISASETIKADFCLKAKGDSMINARIYDGDIVFIREQPIVENGEIAAVIIGDEATLKRWYYNREQNKLTLVAENPTFEPLTYTNEELEYVKCLGKAVCFMSNL